MAILICVPTVLVLNNKPEAKAWLRFTLSEQPAVKPPVSSTGAVGLPDGRGPAFPTTFRLGETEDYLRPGINVEGKPGTIGIDKSVETRMKPFVLATWLVIHSISITLTAPRRRQR
ncbi:MAG: hypothetical protein R2932_09350 [Caldilineaceae bacterium]